MPRFDNTPSAPMSASVLLRATEKPKLLLKASAVIGCPVVVARSVQALVVKLNRYALPRLDDTPLAPMSA